MSTSSMQRWLLASAVTLGVHVLVAGAGVAVAQEQDHLEGYKFKDLNKVPAPSSANLVNQFGAGGCVLKKPQYFLVSSAKNGGNDPRGGAVADFVCYKATCAGPLPPTTAANSQFGTHSLAKAKAKLLCLPVQVCGDNVREGTEACDGTDATACPGQCEANCTCPPQVCGDNVREGTEACDGTDAAACPGQCEANCTCPTQVCGNNVREGTEACDGTDAPACPGQCQANCTCPCGVGGQVVGGFCWYLGAAGDSCISTCSVHGINHTCAAGTASYAGSPNGTDTNCIAVMQALGVPYGFEHDFCVSDDPGTGCGIQDIGLFPYVSRCITNTFNQPTTCAAQESGTARACACD